MKYSVIDGLQRLYCYCIAILLVWRREKLIEDRCIPEDAWEYFKEAVASTGDSPWTYQLVSNPYRAERPPTPVAKAPWAGP